MRVKYGYVWNYRSHTWVFRPVEGSSVILTVPHDCGSGMQGWQGMFQIRDKGVIGRDTNVWPIVDDIRLESRVNVVRGMIPRLLIDYNRAEEEMNFYPLSKAEAGTAVTDRRLLRFYRYYHGVVARLIESELALGCRSQILLLDMHGYSDQPAYGDYDIILGTANRATVWNGIDERLADFLIARRYRVFLPGDRPVGEVEDVRAGNFTVRYYSALYAINALQVEVAKHFRTEEGTKDGQALAANFAEFFRTL